MGCNAHILAFLLLSMECLQIFLTCWESLLKSYKVCITFRLLVLHPYPEYNIFCVVCLPCWFEAKKHILHSKRKETSVSLFFWQENWDGREWVREKSGSEQKPSKPDPAVPPSRLRSGETITQNVIKYHVMTPTTQQQENSPMKNQPKT